MRTAKQTSIRKLHIKKDDKVQVMAGKAKGEIGPVLRVDADNDRLYVKGVNLQMRHTKPRSQGAQGGIIEIEGPIHFSNVHLYCGSCGRGVRTRTEVVEKRVKNRVCARCGETIS